MTIISKLVRDKIPEILREKGRLIKVNRVEGNELCYHLLKKLNEEVDELKSNLSIEEIADVLEVLEAITRTCLGKTMNEVMSVKEMKKKKLGGFDKGLIATYYE